MQRPLPACVQRGAAFPLRRLQPPLKRQISSRGPATQPRPSAPVAPLADALYEVDLIHVNLPRRHHRGPRTSRRTPTTPRAEQRGGGGGQQARGRRGCLLLLRGGQRECVHGHDAVQGGPRIPVLHHLQRAGRQQQADVVHTWVGVQRWLVGIEREAEGQQLVAWDGLGCKGAMHEPHKQLEKLLPFWQGQAGQGAHLADDRGSTPHQLAEVHGQSLAVSQRSKRTAAASTAPQGILQAPGCHRGRSSSGRRPVAAEAAGAVGLRRVWSLQRWRAQAAGPAAATAATIAALKGRRG